MLELLCGLVKMVKTVSCGCLNSIKLGQKQSGVLLGGTIAPPRPPSSSPLPWTFCQGKTLSGLCSLKAGTVEAGRVNLFLSIVSYNLEWINGEVVRC